MFRCVRLRGLTLFSAAVIIFITMAVIIPKADTKQTFSGQEEIFLPAIMYHSILKNEQRQGKFVVSPAVLEKDLIYLKENGYNSIGISELVDYVYNGVAIPPKPVLITLDDGYYNNAEYLLPLLKKYEMKAVISVVGAFTEKSEKEGGHHPAYSYLMWDDIRLLQDSGYIEVGNHTWGLHENSERLGAGKLSWESDEDYKKVLNDDLGKLQKYLYECTGSAPVVFTFPFGSTSKESTPILKELGFKATLTCRETPNYITREPDCLFGIGRYNRPAGISTEEFMEKALKNPKENQKNA